MLYRHCFSTILRISIRKVQENQVGVKLNGTYQLLAYTHDVNLLEGNMDNNNNNNNNNNNKSVTLVRGLSSQICYIQFLIAISICSNRNSLLHKSNIPTPTAIGDFCHTGIQACQVPQIRVRFLVRNYVLFIIDSADKCVHGESRCPLRCCIWSKFRPNFCASSL
jgi:hypothetical protein